MQNHITVRFEFTFIKIQNETVFRTYEGGFMLAKRVCSIAP